MSNNTDPKIQEIKERHEVAIKLLEEFPMPQATKVQTADISYLLSEIERLQTENKVMEVVLKWYADKDEGERARIALSHLKG